MSGEVSRVSNSFDFYLLSINNKLLLLLLELDVTNRFTMCICPF